VRPFRGVKRLRAALEADYCLADCCRRLSRLLHWSPPEPCSPCRREFVLRKQLALFQEREKKAKPTTAADRFVLSKLARWFAWRNALAIVKPATLIGWHRTAFRCFWRWKSRSVGRPPISAEVRELIRRMAAENPTWVKSESPMNFGSNFRFGSPRARWASTSDNCHIRADLKISVGQRFSGIMLTALSPATSSSPLL
jgi:hypothetical protein